MKIANLIRGSVLFASSISLAHPASMDQAAISHAVEKSIARLLPSGPSFVKQSNCVSCHNNTLPVMSASLARERGLRVDPSNEAEQLETIEAFLALPRELLLEASYAVPDTQVSVPYMLLALYAEHVPANGATAAAVHGIAARQLPDGSWPSYINRAPIENGDIQATALSLQAIRIYGMPGRSQEWARRIADAREWLRKAAPVTTEDRIMHLYGLSWSNADAEEVKHAARTLLAEQRVDGGWAQLKTLDSDAYATGKALAALHECGMLKSGDAAYRRGIEFLMKAQQPDGTWRVKTRAFPFQPLKESGFPHGRDQWISAAATSWAAMALTYAVDPQRAVPLESRIIGHP